MAGPYEIYVVAYVTVEGDLMMERVAAADELHALNMVLKARYESVEVAQDHLDDIGWSVGVMWAAYDEGLR